MNNVIRFRRRKDVPKHRTHWRGADFAPRKRRRFKIRLSPLLVMLIISVAAIGYSWIRSGSVVPGGLSDSFGICGEGGYGRNCVIDGDTFIFQGEKIRIADIDTPETFQSKCEAEAELGKRATYRLHELLNDGSFTLETWGDLDRDKYGRLLRRVSRDGKSLGSILISEGLARPWVGRRLPWC